MTYFRSLCAVFVLILVRGAGLTSNAWAAAINVQDNLLNNSGFEDGLNGWTTVSSSAVLVNYGELNAPTGAVAAKISGGGKFVRDAGGNAVIEQIVQLPVGSEGKQLCAGGYFGGVAKNNDSSRLVVRFLNQADGEIERKTLDYVTRYNRNEETVLMLRESVLAIPPGTKKVAARIEFLSLTWGQKYGAAEGVFLKIVTGGLIPAPVPSGVDLVTNGGFENGWTKGSPLSLNNIRGWEGSVPPQYANYTKVTVLEYSNTAPEFVPSVLVSDRIGGGASLLSGLDSSDSSVAIRQRVDVRGNAVAGGFSGQILRVSSFVGGVSDWKSISQVNVRFLNSELVSIAPNTPLGPVYKSVRNFETIVLKQTGDYEIPQNTSYFELEVEFKVNGAWESNALVDNVQAFLVPKQQLSPVPLNQNLISNPSFESPIGIPVSPLEPGNDKGWFGALNGTKKVEVRKYGESQDLPGIPSGSNGALGASFAYSPKSYNYGAGLIQSIDVRGAAVQIDSGILKLKASAWIGGMGSYSSTAVVQIRCVNESGIPLAAVEQIGPVSAVERNNTTTLLPKALNVPASVPIGTRWIQVEVQFLNGSYSNSGLVDAIRVELVGPPAPPPPPSPDVFDALRISAAATYSGALLNAYASYTGASPAKKDIGKLNIKINAAFDKFTAAYNKAYTDAIGKGVEPTCKDTAYEVASYIEDDIEDAYEDITTGMNPEDSVDRKLRSKMLKSLGAMMKGVLVAKATHVKSPNQSLLNESELKMKFAFEKSASSAKTAAAKAGVTYNGMQVNQLAAKAQMKSNNIQTKLHKP